MGGLTKKKAEGWITIFCYIHESNGKLHQDQRRTFKKKGKKCVYIYKYINTNIDMGKGLEILAGITEHVHFAA